MGAVTVSITGLGISEAGAAHYPRWLLIDVRRLHSPELETIERVLATYGSWPENLVVVEVRYDNTEWHFAAMFESLDVALMWVRLQ